MVVDSNVLLAANVNHVVGPQMVAEDWQDEKNRKQGCFALVIVIIIIIIITGILQANM